MMRHSGGAASTVATAAWRVAESRRRKQWPDFECARSRTLGAMSKSLIIAEAAAGQRYPETFIGAVNA
jgi:hypothetical protein